MWSVILTDLKALLAKIEAFAQEAETEFLLIWQKSFPAAEQAAINALTPLATTIITDLQNQGGLTNKQIGLEALSQLETAAIAAGKDFVMTFAMQAISTVQAQLAGNVSASTVSNAGTLPNGTQTGG